MEIDKQAAEAAETAEFLSLVRQVSDEGRAKFLAWCQQLIADAEAAELASKSNAAKRAA